MKVCFVVGTTASGKSELAINLAKENNGAIINCDSIQTYQGLKIGSALPSPKEMAEVPHFLFSYIPKGGKNTAGQYARKFYELMDSLEKKFSQVYVVGGTGFYFQAIEKGMFDVEAANESVRLDLEKRLKDPEQAIEIYKKFAELDPESAKKIFINDHYRLARAMELMQIHNKPLSQIRKDFEKSIKPFNWPLEKIGLSPEKTVLLKRVEERTKKMLKMGLIEEVQSLVDEGFAGWEALQSVGYKETLQFLLKYGEINNLEQLKNSIVQNTMKLAKKQRTWFKRDSSIRWL